MAFVNLLGGCLGMTHAYITGLPSIVIWLNGFLMLFGGLFFYWSRVQGKGFALYILYMLLLDSLALGVMWFYNAGISGTIIYIYFGCMAIGLVLSRKAVLITSTILLIVLIVLGLEYYHPEWVVPYPNREAQFSDFFFAILLTAFMISFAVANLRKNYDVERRTVEEQNQELWQLNEEISRQNESIYQQNIELEKLNQLKNRLFSVVAHDFRNPLNSFRYVLEMIEEDGLDEEEKKMVNRQLAHEIQYTAAFIDNLLNWTKNQMQGIQTTPTALDLQHILAENLQLMRAQIQQKKLKVINQVSSHCRAWGDSEMIKLVARNLLSNAIKFSYEGGEILLSSHSQTHEIVFKIQDLGKGISPEGQKKLFGKDYFFTKGTANEKGSGLGLILCKDFLEKNQGKIWFESSENQGSTFYFSLPKVEV
ncbi:MAG: HAMP domain-containing histidine kinase [Microscillaceae bacterium]|jgi:signal transduction histidine kinase|nr:HAMP domain-containing histidine kinase [Microscillaceae bacterium]